MFGFAHLQQNFRGLENLTSVSFCGILASVSNPLAEM